MGFSKATFSDLLAKPDIYGLVTAEHALILPNHAEYLYQAGYPEICAIDFYDSIFGEDLAPHRKQQIIKRPEILANRYRKIYIYR